MRSVSVQLARSCLAAASLAVVGCYSEPNELATSSDDDGPSASESDAATTGDLGSGGATSSDAATDASEGEGSDGDASDGTTVDTAGDASSGEAEVGEVRAVHAAAELGAVDVYVVGQRAPIATGLTYADASAWIVVTAGEQTLELRPAGEPSGPVLLTAAITVEPQTRVTAIAGVEPDGRAGDRALRVLPLREDWGPALAGRARARLVHASPDAPAFAVEGADVAGLLAPFSASAPAGFGLDAAGGVRVELLESEAADASLVTSFTAPPVLEGDEVLLIAAGELGTLARQPRGFALIAVGREGSLGIIRQDPELFVLHGSRDAAGLELCVGDTELAANLQYAELASTRISPGIYGAGIYDYPSGCVGEALGTNSTGLLEAGQRYLMLLTGEVVPENAGEAGIQLATFDDAFTLDDAQGARVRFVHGASYSQIYVGAVASGQITADNVLTQPIGWSIESAEVAVPAGSYVLGIADAVGKPEPPYTPIVTLAYDAIVGARQWAIVAGDPTPDDADPLQALVVDTTTAGWGVGVVDLQ